MRIELEAEDAVDIQLAPLLDCVFLLLIFFLIASTMKQPVPELDLQLPVAGATLHSGAGADPLVIAIDREGGLWIDELPVGPALLKRRVRAAAVADPETRVRLEADRALPLQRIVEIFEICRFEGLRQIGVHVAREDRRGGDAEP